MAKYWTNISNIRSHCPIVKIIFGLGFQCTKASFILTLDVTAYEVNKTTKLQLDNKTFLCSKHSSLFCFLPIGTLISVISVTRSPICVFNIWPFSAMKRRPISYKLCQSELKTLPKTKSTLSILPFLNYLPKWWNFAKYGHPGRAGSFEEWDVTRP